MKKSSKLDPRKRYLQISLNNNLEEAYRIISYLPLSDQIILEAGTPLVKRYGIEAVSQIKKWYESHLLLESRLKSGTPVESSSYQNLENYHQKAISYKEYPETKRDREKLSSRPYVVADLKTMDRAEVEVKLAASAGADAAIALGCAPIESLNIFIEKCEEYGLDSMIDMMNIEFPLSILRNLRKLPQVVILHRGVDEKTSNKEKEIPLHEIRRIKGNYDIMIAIAGGDTSKEIRSAVFNDANIVIVWENFYQSSPAITKITQDLLKEIS